MSKFSDHLRAVRVFNNFDMLKRFGTAGDVAIEYIRPAAGRLGWCEVRRTSVWSPYPHAQLSIEGIKKHGEKQFFGNRAHSLPTALAWARKTFGGEYVPSPHGGYLPKHVVDKARAFVEKAGMTATGKEG
jgi:hypothetical protein